MASGLALAVYVLLLVPAALLVWRRPVLALYAWLVGLAAHNAVMAALYGAGVRGGALTALQAWKEILLAVALSSRGGSNGGSRGTTAVVVSTPAVQPIPQGATPQEQARNLAAWLRQHSAGG